MATLKEMGIAGRKTVAVGRCCWDILVLFSDGTRQEEGELVVDVDVEAESVEREASRDAVRDVSMWLASPSEVRRLRRF